MSFGLWTEAFNGAPVDPDSAAAAIDAAGLLESMGHDVERSAPAVYSDEQLWDVAKQALAASAAAEAAAWAPRIGHALGEADLEPRTWAMVQAGLSEHEARQRSWLFDVGGLVQSERTDLTTYQAPFAHDHPPSSDFASLIEERVRKQVPARRENPTAVTVFSLVASIPLIAIAGSLGGLVGIALVCAALVLVNWFAYRR